MESIRGRMARTPHTSWALWTVARQPPVVSHGAELRAGLEIPTRMLSTGAMQMTLQQPNYL